MTESITLKISPDSPTNRIIVGLSWDMRALEKFELPKPEFVKNSEGAQLYLGGIENTIHAFRSKLFYKKHMNPKDDLDDRNTEFEQFDLDLECHIFDKHHKLIHKISPDYTELHNDNSSVFHSGEDYTGIGPFDDEDISIKMNAIPNDYHHFLFTVKSDCAFDLDEITNPKIRIYDAYSNEETYSAAIKSDIANNSLYVFAALSKTENGWSVNPINTYGDYDDNIEEILKDNLG